MKKKFLKSVAVCMAVTMILTIAGCKKEEPVRPERVPVKTETVAWDDNEFKRLLPKPEFEEIIILGEYDDWFGFDSLTFTKEQCDAYAEECRARGFTEEVVYCKGYWFWAKNKEGYELEINYDQGWFRLIIDNMSIE